MSVNLLDLALDEGVSGESRLSSSVPGISVSGLGVSYGGDEVISGLDVEIENGRFFTLLGPSGCGKTTLLRTIAGFVKASRGKISFGGKDVTKLPPHRRDIGMVFQDYALFPDKTVMDNVAYGLRARNQRGETMLRKVETALDRVGLSSLMRRYPAELSGGQRQRVALARALVIQPQVLLMDEPLSNLDAKLRVQIRETIMELQREARITTVFVTHDQEEALSMSDKIGVMNQGRIEQLGTPKDIYASPMTPYVADFVGAANQIPVSPRSMSEKGKARVELGGTWIAAACGTSHVPTSGILIVRPEDLGLAKVGGEAQGILGKVVQRQYLGSKTSYRVVLAKGEAVNVELHGDEHDRFAIGESVLVEIDSQKAMVLES